MGLLDSAGLGAGLTALGGFLGSAAMQAMKQEAEDNKLRLASELQRDTMQYQEQLRREGRQADDAYDNSAEVQARKRDNMVAMEQARIPAAVELHKQLGAARSEQERADILAKATPEMRAALHSIAQAQHIGSPGEATTAELAKMKLQEEKGKAAWRAELGSAMNEKNNARVAELIAYGKTRFGDINADEDMTKNRIAAAKAVLADMTSSQEDKNVATAYLRSQLQPASGGKPVDEGIKSFYTAGSGVKQTAQPQQAPRNTPAVAGGVPPELPLSMQSIQNQQTQSATRSYLERMKGTAQR